MTYTGHCLCGAVRFRIDGELEPIQVCHCSQCRRAQGGPFATNIPVSTAAFRLEAGEDLLRSFESSPGKERVFCSRCGSPLFSRKRSLPGVVRVRAGLINEPIRSGLAWHMYVGSKANWWPVADDDGLPHYEAGRPA